MTLRWTQPTYPRAAGDAPAAGATATDSTGAPGAAEPREAPALPYSAAGAQTAVQADGDEALIEGNDASTQAQGATPSAAAEPAALAEAAKTASTELASTEPSTLADALLRAVQESALQAEQETLRAMAAQSGLPEARLAALLSGAQEKQRAEAPLAPAVRARLIAAEVKGAGADIGLLDADAAARLLDPDAVAVDAQGAVTGVREALAALKRSKGYLFSQPARGAWAQPLGGGAQPLGGVEEAFYRKNPALRK